MSVLKKLRGDNYVSSLSYQLSDTSKQNTTQGLSLSVGHPLFLRIIYEQGVIRSHFLRLSIICHTV